MSAKVYNTPTVEVPEASPDANNQKQADSVNNSTPRSRRNLWMGLAALAALVLTVSIAVPLSLKKAKNDDTNENGAATTPATSSEQNAESVSPGVQMCLEPTEDCITEASYQGCLALANSGCEAILSTFSCPPQYRCGNAKAEQLPQDAVACTVDAKECPDGSFVGRVAPTCEFEACPGKTTACTMEVKTCPDGGTVGRTGPNCEFVPCYEAITGACSRELAICPDGTPVGRSGPNCHFDACPGGACPMGAYTCDDGTELDRDPSLGCEFPKCSESISLQGGHVACTDEAKICPDGTSVGRTGPSCEFDPCP